MLVHAVLQLLPWYAWAGIAVLLVLGIAGITYLGLWAPVLAILRGAAAAFRALPTNVKVAIIAVLAIAGAAIGAVLWLNVHDQELTAAVTAKVTAERDSYWSAREKAANDAYTAAITALNRKLEIAYSNAQAAAKKAAAEAAAREAKHQADMDALRAQRRNDVTEKANAACDLHRGVILHFNAGAAVANGSPAGEDPGAARSDALDVDASAGVSLDTYVAGVEDTQRALGTARGQVIAWQAYYATVLQPWITTTIDALSSCVPKGEPAP